jgi:hypothetical protein
MWVFQYLYTMCVDHVRIISISLCLSLLYVWSLQAPPSTHSQKHIICYCEI